MSKKALRYKSLSVGDSKDVTKPVDDSEPSAPPLTEILDCKSLDEGLRDINMPRSLSSLHSLSSLCGSIDSITDIKISKPLSKPAKQPIPKPVLDHQKKMHVTSNYHNSYGSETKSFQSSSLGFRNLTGPTMHPATHTSYSSRTHRSYAHSDGPELYHRDTYNAVRPPSTNYRRMQMPMPRIAPVSPRLHSVRKPRMYPPVQTGYGVPRPMPQPSMFNSMSMPSLVNVGPNVQMHGHHSPGMYDMNPRVHLDPLERDGYYPNRMSTSDYDLYGSASSGIGFENINHSPKPPRSMQWQNY